MSFENELKKGSFMIGACEKCDEIVWPPTEFCNRCFGTIVLKKGPKEGKILEYSKQEKNYFCLAEFDKNIKIMGRIVDGIPKDNQKIKMKKCGIRNNNYFFEFSLN